MNSFSLSLFKQFIILWHYSSKRLKLFNISFAFYTSFNLVLCWTQSLNENATRYWFNFCISHFLYFIFVHDMSENFCRSSSARSFAVGTRMIWLGWVEAKVYTFFNLAVTQTLFKRIRRTICLCTETTNDSDSTLNSDEVTNEIYGYLTNYYLRRRRFETPKEREY